MTTAPQGRERKRWPLAVALVIVVLLAGLLFMSERTADPPTPPIAGPTICATTPDPPVGGTVSQVTENGVVYNVYTFTSDGTLTPTNSVTADVGDTTVELPAGTDYEVAIEADSGSARIRWPRFCENISQPTAPTLVPPTFSWGAPAYLAGQEVASYTVTYQLSGDAASAVSVYARGSTAFRIDVTGATADECGALNPEWTCVLGSGPLESGRSYEFRAFAVSSTPGRVGQLTPEFVYEAP